MKKQSQVDEELYQKKEQIRIKDNIVNNRPECYKDNYCVYICADGFEKCTTLCEEFTKWAKEGD